MGLFLLKKQNGVGLLGAVMAAALVVVAALSVSYYITNQNRVVMRLETSQQCQQVLKSVLDYIDKDNNSLFITSYGPAIPTGSPTGTVATYPSGVSSSMDGIDRFNFVQGGTRIQSLYAADPTLRFDSDATLALRTQNFNNQTPLVPSSYKFTNSLNIRNTINRLTALAYQRDLCVPDLENMLSNDGGATPAAGGVIYGPSAADQLPGLILNENNVRVILGTNFSRNNGTPFCPNSNLATDIPTAGERATAKVRVQVFTNIDTPNEMRYCMGETTAYFADDNTPPLTILSNISTLSLNGHTQYSCNPVGTELFFDVRSVTNRVATSTPPSCEQCLRTLSDNPTTNPITQCNANNASSPCVESDPGTLFLCRIGEKHWFDMNKDHWEPCDRTAVYGCQSGHFEGEDNPPNSLNSCNGRIALGTVRIVYDGNATVNPQVTSRGTRARIFLSNLTDQRAYEVDVRAVDTRGVLVGKSFEGAVGDATAYLFGPSFVTSRDAPNIQGVDTGGSIVAPAGQADGALTVPNRSVYAGLTGEYQCEAGNVPVGGQVVYPSMPDYVYNILRTETCSLNAVGGVPAGTSLGTCSCLDGYCSGTVNIAQGGNWTASLSVANVCGATGNTESVSWCYEDTTTSPYGGMAVINQTTAAPGLNLTANNSKKCPISAGIGNVTNTSVVYPVINPGATLSTAFTSPTIGWTVANHSGCLQEFFGPQVCSKMTDVCGHQSSTFTTYSSYLGPTATTNSCLAVGTSPASMTQINGNRCVAGLFCSSGYQCLNATSANSNVGRSCASISTGGSYPYNNATAPCSHVNDCGFGKSSHQTGVCAGADYRCVSGTDSTLRVAGICADGGGGCNIPNECLGARRVCHSGSGPYTPVSPEVACTSNLQCNTGIGESCRVLENSGTCRYGSNLCDNDSECAAVPGYCDVESAGVCQAPTNTSCLDCPNSGTLKMCPRVNGGCDMNPPVLPDPSTGRSCSTSPPSCTPGACVRGPEISRTQCLDSGGNVADEGEAGTRTITYNGCNNGCGSCACSTTEVVSCVGDNIVMRYGCYIDTYAYDRPSTTALAEGECTPTNAVLCSVGNVLRTASGMWGPLGDSYIFNNPGDYSTTWTGPAWCTSNQGLGYCGTRDVRNGTFTINVHVVHNPTGRVWDLQMYVIKRVFQVPANQCPKIP